MKNKINITLLLWIVLYIFTIGLILIITIYKMKNIESFITTLHPYLFIILFWLFSLKIRRASYRCITTSIISQASIYLTENELNLFIVKFSGNAYKYIILEELSETINKNEKKLSSDQLHELIKNGLNHKKIIFDKWISDIVIPIWYIIYMIFSIIAVLTNYLINTINQIVIYLILITIIGCIGILIKTIFDSFLFLHFNKKIQLVIKKSKKGKICCNQNSTV